jgi:hypothetical protein
MRAAVTALLRTLASLGPTPRLCLLVAGAAALLTVAAFAPVMVPLGVGFAGLALLAALVDLGRALDPRRLELTRTHGARPTSRSRRCGRPRWSRRARGSRWWFRRMVKPKQATR